MKKINKDICDMEFHLDENKMIIGFTDDEATLVTMSSVKDCFLKFSKSMSSILDGNNNSIIELLKSNKRLKIFNYIFFSLTLIFMLLYFGD